MSLRDELGAQLRGYDDNAWEALTSRGLLRRARKDLPAASPTAEGEDGESLRVRIDGEVVSLPAAGPARATCTCRSTVLCRHVLTACLWLADDAGDELDTLPRRHEELMALDRAALTAEAGTAAVRWAHQFLADLTEAEGDATAGGIDAPWVRFGHPDVTVRYVGGGLPGLIVDQRLPKPDRYRVAAVLAWQRAHGMEQEPPDPPKPRAGTSLDASPESRDRLMRTVLRVLGDAVRIGVSHLSPGIHERLVTLAVWAQGAELHRLSLTLRRLADDVELGLARSAAADEGRLLDTLATTFGLVTALAARQAAGERPPRALVGTARRDYQPVRRLDLVGLGGLPWRTPSGYEGLTCVFWDPGHSRFLTWSDARPEATPGFDPRVRWHQQGPWDGVPSPSSTAGCEVTLAAARLSQDGRISGSGATAVRQAPLARDVLVDRLTVVESWSEIHDAMEVVGPSLLDPPERNMRWAVVRPALIGTPVFDRSRQVLEWPLHDALGATLVAELPWAERNAHAISRIESLSLASGSLVILRVWRAGAGLRAEPVSVLSPDAGSVTDCLHFDGGGDPGTVPDRVTAEGSSTTVPASLASLRTWLHRQGERGTAGANAPVWRDELAERHRDARDEGLWIFGDPSPEGDPAAQLLRSLYLVLQCELALGAE